MDLFDFVTAITMIQALILIIGLIFVIFEMFHPGFGAPGIIGGILLFIGIFLVAKTFMQAFILIVLIMIVLGIALYLVIKSATQGRLSKTMVLSHFQQKENGYNGTEDLEGFLHKEGNTITVLRPSGMAEFDGLKLDVVSEGGFIQPDIKVKVIKVEGRRVVVREI